MKTLALKMWDSAVLVFDEIGNPRLNETPAYKCLKRNGLSLAQPATSLNIRYYPVQEKPDSDLAGYMLFLLHEVSGTPAGVAVFPLNEHGYKAKEHSFDVLSFYPGVLDNYEEWAVRLLDVPPFGRFNVATNILSGLAISKITGERTWASTHPLLSGSLSIPPSISEVCIWSDISDSSNSNLEYLVQGLLDQGVDVVKILSLKSMPQVGVAKWFNVCEHLDIDSIDSFSERIQAAESLALIDERTSFSRYKKAS